MRIYLAVYICHMCASHTCYMTCTCAGAADYLRPPLWSVYLAIYYHISHFRNGDVCMYVCKDSAAPAQRVHAHTGPRRHARAPACHRDRAGYIYTENTYSIQLEIRTDTAGYSVIQCGIYSGFAAKCKMATRYRSIQGLRDTWDTKDTVRYRYRQDTQAKYRRDIPKIHTPRERERAYSHQSEYSFTELTFIKKKKKKKKKKKTT